MITKNTLFLDTGLGLSPRSPEPVVPKQEFSKYAGDIIEEKRAELELKKLEIEIQKLETPNTSVDYFKEMLALQQNHYIQLLAMQRQQSELMLEIEKLKLTGGDDELSYWMEILEPIIPMLLNKQQPGQQQTKEVNDMDKIKKEKYIRLIKEGVISVEDAYKDFNMEMPQLAAKITFEQFKEQFEKIKNDK